VTEPGRTTPPAGSPGVPRGPVPEPVRPGPARPGTDPRNRTARFAWGAVAVILVGVVVLVVYALTGPPSAGTVVHPTSTAT
jgi:hypothetical protein